MKFLKSYSILFALLLVTEVAIALFHFHKFVRGFMGDLLVIPLLYTLIQMIFKTSVNRVICITLSLAFLMEMLQAFRLTQLLNIHNKVIHIILGSTFDPLDLVAYTLGVIPILLIENYLK